MHVHRFLNIRDILTPREPPAKDERKSIMQLVILLISKSAQRIFEFLKPLYNILKGPEPKVSYFVKKCNMIENIPHWSPLYNSIEYECNVNFLKGRASLTKNHTGLYFECYDSNKQILWNIVDVCSKDLMNACNDSYIKISLPRKKGQGKMEMLLKANIKKKNKYWNRKKEPSFKEIILGSFVVDMSKHKGTATPISVFQSLLCGSLAPDASKTYELNSNP